MGAKAGLTLKDVVEEAASLADEVGLDQLSMSALASRLGIRPPSLYNHVDGVDAVRRELSLMAGRELGAALARATVGKSKDDAVLALAQAHRAFVKKRPGLAAASVRAPAKNDKEAQAVAAEVVDICLAVLSGYGLQREDALHAIRALRSSVHGFATMERGGGFGMPLDVDESFRWMVQAFIEAIHRMGSRSV